MPSPSVIVTSGLKPGAPASPLSPLAPSLPSWIIVLAVVPPGFVIVSVRVPSVPSVIVTSGLKPGAPVSPLSPLSPLAPSLPGVPSLPGAPSLITVEVAEPSDLVTVRVCVPSVPSVMVTSGLNPSLPLAPSTPSLPFVPSAPFLPSRITALSVSPPGFVMVSVCVPSSPSVIVTSGLKPSLPLAPSTPSLPFVPSAPFLPSRITALSVSPPGFVMVSVCVPSSPSVIVTSGLKPSLPLVPFTPSCPSLPFLPSRITALDTEPSGFVMVSVCSPVSLSVTVISGLNPSLPLVPFTPSLPFVPSTPSLPSLPSLPSRITALSVVPS